VITEGNYLLLDDPMWVRALRAMDAVWFVAGDERVRVQRLVDRHVEFGKTPPAARAWVAAIDQPDADAVSTTAVNADRIIVNDAAVNSSASKAWGLSDVAARVAVVAMLAATTRAATAAAADDGLGVLDVYGGGLFPVGPVNVVRSAMSSPHGVPPLAVVT
jgi:hypothetical protein